MTNSLIAGLIFGCLFLFCSCISGEIWKKRVFAPIKYIGKHSYGIYCFHQIVINCVFTLSLKNSSLQQWLATFILIAVISCGIGIGDENENEQLKDFSIITFKHRYQDKDLGTIGIIGPKRMDYSKVISVMKYISKKLNGQ